LQNTFVITPRIYCKLYFCDEFQFQIMNMSRVLNFICIVTGGLVTVYAKAQESQNTYLLMGGLVLLMFGIYRTSRNIPSKHEQQEEEAFIKTEDDN
jgi:hypothetical protein